MQINHVNMYYLFTKKFCLMILNEGNIHQVCQHNLNAWHSRAIHVLQCV